MSLLWQHGEPFRGELVLGGLAAVVVTATRLIIPVPLQRTILPWLSAESAPVGGVTQAACSFALLLIVMGAADHLERLAFARFSIGSVRNIRKAAMRGLLRGQGGKEARKGEAIARLVGDTARVKQGLKGFLVHVAVKGLVLFGTAGAVFVLVDVTLGLLFLGAVLIMMVATAVGASAVYRSASRQRSKEGKLADGVLTLIKLRKGKVGIKRSDAKAVVKKLNKTSGRSEARTTLLVGRVTWFAHSVFGLFVLASLLFGARSIELGTMQPDALLLFVLYVVGARAAFVQLSRQGARTGKILAGLERLEPLVCPEPTSSAAVELQSVPTRS